jgi:hypothetical protein
MGGFASKEDGIPGSAGLADLERRRKRSQGFPDAVDVADHLKPGHRVVDDADHDEGL